MSISVKMFHNEEGTHTVTGGNYCCS